MNSFTVETTIAAPIKDVWDVLADISEIYKWNPGVFDSHLTSETTEGEGSSRYCNLGGNNYLHERVQLWSPERALTMRVTQTNLPFEHVDIRFRLAPMGGATRVTVSPEYKLKFGIIGSIMDAVYVRKSYSNGMEALLAGLKKFIENSEGEVILEDE
jgi:uncharacterized protein YndB with AHSA1/START domain